jgi:hypothetical protein
VIYYLSRHLVHPNYLFKMIGPEYKPVVEKAPAEEEGHDHEDDDNDDDATDDDDTEDEETEDDDR